MKLPITSRTRSVRGGRLPLLALLAALLFAVSACAPQVQPATADMDDAGNVDPLVTTPVEPEEFDTLETATYQFYATPGSAVEGTVQIVESDGTARVTVTLTGAVEGASYPAHLHAGDCGTSGAIVYPLETIVGGPDSAVTEIAASVFEITSQDLYINIHASPDDLATILACGEVGLGADTP